MPNQNTPHFLHKQINWKDLFFYQKTEVLYQLTIAFCQRFLPPHGDRTVDQMTQAARSGKQNIVEGLADGVTSNETQIKLLNVARASIQELQEDFSDYLTAHYNAPWDDQHPRYSALLTFCRNNNSLTQYQPFFNQWSDEEMANTGYTLCHMVDAMMNKYIKGMEQRFVENGGIRERMTAARLGMRQTQKEQIAALQSDNNKLTTENNQLKQQITTLKQEITTLKQEIENLRTLYNPL